MTVWKQKLSMQLFKLLNKINLINNHGKVIAKTNITLVEYLNLK